MTQMIIFRGLPGSGKSTRAKKEYPNHLHYEPDHLLSDTNGKYRFDMQVFDKAHDFVTWMVDLALARGENVVVSDVFPRHSDMARYLEVAEAHGAEVKVVTCTEQYGNCHNVPLFVLKEMRAAFES